MIGYIWAIVVIIQSVLVLSYAPWFGFASNRARILVIYARRSRATSTVHPRRARGRKNATSSERDPSCPMQHGPSVGWPDVRRLRVRERSRDGTPSALESFRSASSNGPAGVLCDAPGSAHVDERDHARAPRGRAPAKSEQYSFTRPAFSWATSERVSRDGTSTVWRAPFASTTARSWSSMPRL